MTLTCKLPTLNKELINNWSIKKRLYITKPTGGSAPPGLNKL